MERSQGEASHPGPSSPCRQSRLLQREGPFRRCWPTQIDSDCEPLVNRGRFGVLSSDSDNEELAVSVCRAPPHAMERGIAVPVSEGCPHVPKRLRLTRNQSRPPGVLEHDLIRSERDVPPPMCPPSVGPAQSEAASERMDDQATGQSSRAEIPRSPSRSLQATDVDHHNSPQPSLFQDLQYEVLSEVADAEIQSDLHCTIPATSRRREMRQQILWSIQNPLFDRWHGTCVRQRSHKLVLLLWICSTCGTFSHTGHV